MSLGDNVSSLLLQNVHIIKNGHRLQLLRNSDKHSFILIPGFKVFRNDTVEVRGGVSVYIREKFVVEARM